MTTPAAAELYKAEHVYAHEQLNTAMFNPLAKTIHDLPAIFGFNNGGSAGWLSAILMAEDGTHLGGHVCSDEVYMPADLGILDGTRPDRHEIFRHITQMDIVWSLFHMLSWLGMPRLIWRSKNTRQLIQIRMKTSIWLPIGTDLLTIYKHAKIQFT
jgi:hypothetical protein